MPSHISLRSQIKVSDGCLHLQYKDPLATPDTDIRFVQNTLPLRCFSIPYKLQMEPTFDNQIYLYYAGLKARLGFSLKLTCGNLNPISSKGEISLLEGVYYFGNYLQLETNARLIFKECFYNSSIELSATRSIPIQSSNSLNIAQLSLSNLKLNVCHSEVAKVNTQLPMNAKVGIHLRGDLEAPTMNLFSQPSGWITDATDALGYLMGYLAHTINQSAATTGRLC